MCARPCTPRLCGVGRGRRPRRPGPRGRIVHRRRPCACAGRAAEDVRPYHVYGPARHMMCARFCTPRLCGVGRGRRPRRPARTHRPPASSLCVRRAGGRGRPPLPCIRPCAPHDMRGPARPPLPCARLCARHGPRVRGARAWGRRSRKWRRVVSIWPLRTSLPISVERADRSTLR